MDGKRLGRPEHVERVRLARDRCCPVESRCRLACRIDQRCCLAEDASCGEDDAGDDGRHGGRDEHLGRCLPAGEAESKGSVPLVARHCLERLLDDADQDRHIEHRERESAREDREAPAELQDEDQHAEEADDDRREARERLDRGLRDARDRTDRCVLRQEDGTAKRDRERDK